MLAGPRQGWRRRPLPPRARHRVLALRPLPTWPPLHPPARLAQVTLLDSPGVVFADAGAEGAAAAALRNAVKAEQLPDPALPVAEIVRRCPAKQLMRLYKVAAYQGPDQFLQLVATARGKLKRGGAVDTTAAARIVLQVRWSGWGQGQGGAGLACRGPGAAPAWAASPHRCRLSQPAH